MNRTDVAKLVRAVNAFDRDQGKVRFWRTADVTTMIDRLEAGVPMVFVDVETYVRGWMAGFDVACCEGHSPTASPASVKAFNARMARKAGRATMADAMRG